MNATSKGYVPSKLPATWKPQCEMPGMSTASHWAKVVKLNSSTDWGLCQECLTELNGFSPRAPVSGEMFATALGYCMHFTLKGMPMPAGMSATLKTLALKHGLTNDEIGQIAADTAILKKNESFEEMRDFISQALDRAGEKIKSSSPPGGASAASQASGATPGRKWWQILKK